MKKRDFILIAIIFVISLSGYIFIKLTGSTGDALSAFIRVTVDGKEYGVYSLDKDTKLDIKSSAGHNVLCIKDGEAYMKEADCPDGYCVKQGSVSRVNEAIICLPHKVVVEVVKYHLKSNNKNSEVDTVSK